MDKTMDERYTVRWGILGKYLVTTLVSRAARLIDESLATGRIAEKFARDLLIDPTTRGVLDTVHVLAGVASSRSVHAASGFKAKVKAPHTCQAFESYSQLVHSPSIDVVYIATPHSHHFQNAMLSLEAGKHVLCEKPLTVNAEQAQKLFATAKQKQRFLMEGLWTRFQPASIEVRQLIQDHAIGDITRIFADNSLGLNSDRDLAPGDRLVVKELAGGALLDLGVYSINWALQALPRGCCRPTRIMSAVSEHPGQHGKPDIQVVVSASLRSTTDADGQTPSVRIQGDKGEVQVLGRPWCPRLVRVVEREQGMESVGTVRHEIPNLIPADAHGLCFEMDEVARCIRRGLLESPDMTWKESLTVLEIMDSVRSENGVSFPISIESTDYPLELNPRA